MSSKQKVSLISPVNQLSISRQCELLDLARSSYYYNPVEALEETNLMNEISEIWLEHSFLGYRKITHELKNRGHDINHKRVLKLMQLMGIQSMQPGPHCRTTIPNRQNEARPYLLNSLVIESPNKVWATDITYIKLPTGMTYLFAIIDWYSRYVVSWKLANTMEAYHGIEVLERALELGIPEIINADQGSQYTGSEWTNLCDQKGILVSHNGVGRCIDNIRIERFWRSVKYERIHLFLYEKMVDLIEGLTEYIVYYNTRRLHQALQYRRPADLYFV